MTQSVIRALSISTLLLALAPRPARAVTCSRTPSVKYYGGPIIQNPKIVMVLWGGGVNSQLKTNLSAFYTALMSSNYFDWLSEYNTAGLTGQDGQPGSNQGLSRGSVAGVSMITPSICADKAACTLTDAQLEQELAAQMAAGTLPAPTQGCDGKNNTVYMVHFPSNVTITVGTSAQSCVTFCYAHGDGSYNGKAYAYAILPDVTTGGCAGGCGANAMPLNNQTAVASAALVSAITDPNVGQASSVGRPLAWYDPNCGEIPNICNAEQGTITVGAATWTVQQQWSNTAAACVVTRSSLPAICTGSGTPAGCRPCTCADDNQGASGQVGCSGSTPRCDVALGGATYGQCVATGTGGTGGTAGSGGAGGGTGGGIAGAAGGGTGGIGGGGSGGTTGGAGGLGGGSAGTGGGAGGATGGSAGGAGGGSGAAGGSGGAGGTGGKPEGTEGGACYGNGTCNMGLTCLSHVCVMAPKSSGGCGCAFGGSSDASALAVVALILALVATRTRRRRPRR